MRKAIIAVIAAAVALPTVPAFADPPGWAPAHGWRDKQERRGRHYWKGDRYYRDGRYDGRRLRRDDRIWRGNDGRYYCKRDNGTTGLIIGAAGGALLGRMIDTDGDRLLGTLLGGAGGALLGREIDRGDVRCK